MEDLLASIRKAIQEDIGEVPSSTSIKAAGTLYKGGVREFHVKASADAPTAAAEIQELRERINRSRLEAPRESVFAEVIEEQVLPEPRRRRGTDVPAPPLRQSYAEQEVRAPEPPRGDFLRRGEREFDRAGQAPGWREDETIRQRPAADPWQRPETGILSPDTAQATGAAFQRLADSILNRATGDRSVEDMTRDLLRGMLKQWLDDNLPALVESMVREEIERVARRGR
jgi:hypothetical protein